MYTLIMVDADIPNSLVGNATHPLVHWLVTNIREGNMSTGSDTNIYLIEYHSSNTKFVNMNEDVKHNLSPGMRFPTMWYMQPAKPQISLRICAV